MADTTNKLQRALCAVQLSHPEKLTSAFDACYAAMWVDRKPVQKPEVFTEVLASVLGSADAAAAVVKKVRCVLAFFSLLFV